MKKVREAESIGIYSALNKVSVSETKRIEDRNILWVNNHTKTHRKISSAPVDKQEFTQKDTQFELLPVKRVSRRKKGSAMASQFS